MREAFADRHKILEIASGTGQHAIHFAKRLPHLIWQTSDLPANHAGIEAWLTEAKLSNVLPPLRLDVRDPTWPVSKADGIFCANAVHIMSWDAVKSLFRGIGQILGPGGIACFYGPFNYGGKFTSASNARFDQWLKANDPESGVRDFEAINSLAEEQGLFLLKDVEMPANNRTLLWQAPLKDHGLGN